MALNKRKVLEAARKHAQKGAKAKALKEYNRLLQADPRDAKLLLEVGDAYRRWGQAEEAIAQYGKVAQQYRQDGFDARAVAVYKQILNLDPKHHAAYVSLSELYQRMGLDAEAISALQTAADGYHKEGRKTEALELLRQTAALDPSNTTSRLKVAELLRQEGMESEALSEYKAVAAELESQQDRDQLMAVLRRILELKPEDVGTLCSLARHLMTSGDLDKAEPFATRALEAEREPAQFELLMDLYAQAGQDEKLASVTRDLAKLFRERGDDDKARELMQRLPGQELASASQAPLSMDVSEVAEPDLADDELLEDEPFLALTDEAEPLALAAEDEISLDVAADAPAPSTAAAPVELPEGDPDQLLAEASVYLRYGKRDQAIASLRGVLAQDPTHRAALEKLGEAHADGGEKAEAIAAWTKAAGIVREAGDGDALAVLRDRIAALDPAAAEQIGSIVTADADDDASGMDLDLDVELDLDTSLDETNESDAQSALDVDDGGAEFEIEIDDDSLNLEDVTEDEDPPATSLDVTEPDLDDDGGIEFEIDTGEDAEDASEGQSSTTTAKIQEELEEAEFYVAQEMYDEAETILKRVLEMAPNHPSAMLRMGEIEAARSAVADVDGRDEAVPDTDTTVTDADDDLDVEIDLDLDDDEASPDVGIAAADATDDTAPADTSAGDLELDIEDDTLSATEQAPPREAPEDTQPTASLDEAPAPSAAGTGPDSGDSFDLREALADVLEDDEPAGDPNDTSGVLSTVEDGFGSIFADFKKGVSETLAEGDYETRYDLGIAYREMGLFEDAIGEFRVCLDSPARRFDSLFLMGICARELGRFGDAVNHLEQALALPEIPQERLAGVYFDLSLAQEGAGDTERAAASIQRVLELDAGFPGAAERLAALEAGTTTPKLASPGDDFETFDELFSDDDEDGDEALVESVPEETFESFDDLIEEAEVIGENSEPRPDPNEDSKATSKSRRKKISFL